MFENQEGFSLWFDSQKWKITDKIGGGKTISVGEDSINAEWKNGAKARFYPDEEYAKDATFRLAVAFRGRKTTRMRYDYLNNSSWITPTTSLLPKLT